MLKSFTDWAGDIGISYRNLKVMHRARTKRYRIEVCSSGILGKVLILNDELQHASNWEFLYHEPLVHLPAAFIVEPKKALIIGGGSLNALRELAKYRSLEKIRLVDIDHKVISVMIKSDPALGILANDKRVEMLEEDGYKYLERTSEEFDLIINDACDLTKVLSRKPAAKIFFERLTEEGVCADVVYRHILDHRTLSKTLGLLRDFNNLAFSLILVPEYPGALHLLTMWGKNPNVSQSLKRPCNRDQLSWIESGRIPCRYYDPSALTYFLYLPRYLRQKLEESPLEPKFR